MKAMANEQQKRSTSTELAASQSHAPPAVVPTAPVNSSLLETALQRLPAEQQDALMEKALQHRLELEVEAAKADQRHANSAEEMQQYLHQAKGYSNTGSDYRLTQHGKTQSGGWEAEISKRNYTLYIVIAVVIGACIAFVFGR